MALQKKLPADSTSNNQSYNSTNVHYVYWYCREGASALGKNTRRVVPLWSLALVAQNKEKKNGVGGAVVSVPGTYIRGPRD